MREGLGRYGVEPVYMMIEYSTQRGLSAEQFISVLERSGLAERRPVGDRARLEGMLAQGNLLCTAWAGDLLVGVARSVTDFSYCCYLSDLAVDRAYQRGGIGRELMRRTKLALHPEAKVILLAAPLARDYYGRVGLEQHPSAWVLSDVSQLR